jgi:glutathione S-transferase
VFLNTAPLQSPNVQSRHSADETEKNRWAQDFIKRGLTTYQKLINPNTDFSLGDIITAADLFLIPQIYNAKRYGINVADEFPSLNKIYEKALNTPECIKASPENQIDSLKV